ncbi:hypothetical protein BRC2024_ULFKEANI_CDS_0217 [Acinetobacter phage vB_AbaM_Konradin-v2]
MKFEDVKVGEVVQWGDNYKGRDYACIVAFKNVTTGKVLIYRIVDDRNMYPSYRYFDLPVEVPASELKENSWRLNRVLDKFKFIVNNKEEKAIYESLGFTFDNWHLEPAPSSFPFYYSENENIGKHLYTKEEYDNILLPQYKLENSQMVLDDSYAIAKFGASLSKMSDVEK